MSGLPATPNPLAHLPPRRPFFVGVDSDGSVFDSMTAKQTLCIQGLIADFWNLRPIEAALREVGEFVNLYSCHRGQNRFHNLVRTFDLLRRRPDAAAAGVTVPDLPQTRCWLASPGAPSPVSLAARAAETGDPELARLLRWNEAVDAAIARRCPRFPPFPAAPAALRRMADAADLVCLSQSPAATLEREWTEAGLRGTVRFLAGVEFGCKSDQLRLAAAGKYPADQILMIGDAPGDRQAAREAGALFFPIPPGSENAAWERLASDAFDRFLNGQYAGAYETALIASFDSQLPDSPPWTRTPKS